VQRTVQDAEKRGYDRAMNQTVKQQYWIIQNQQRQPAQGQDARLVPVVIPESKINGVIQKAHVEYLKIES
jgi:fructose-bisphosphate aldolase class 1